MAAPSTPTTGMTNISVLSYSILFDISGAIPNIVLTNLSTVSDYSKLKWWYVITTPSGTPIHTGSVTTPDVNGVSWTTLQITPGDWPLLFGNSPCAQVEFSPGAPYVCTLYVHDNDVPSITSFGLPISQVIVRPNGNTEYSCGNFGVAKVSILTKCNDRVIFCNDATNFAYNSILTPVAGSQVNTWTLVYPSDPNGNQPANGTATNTPYVNFPIQYSGSGYVLNLRDYATYDMGNGATIAIQYKAINKETGAPGLTFSVLCNIDLCKLQCQIKTFYDLSKQKCGRVDDPELMDKMTRMNLLLWEATTGILQPLCGIDVPAIIAQIQKVGNLPQDCNCGCTDTGINFSYPLSPGTSSSGGCCPVTTNIINTTVSPPTSCENTTYPVRVYDPTNTTVVGIANDLNGIIQLLNSTSSWSNYGVAFSEGYCKVGWFPATAGNTIPDVNIDSATNTTTCTGNTQNYVVNMVDVCLPLAPITASQFPLNAYVDYGSGVPLSLGVMADQAALIAALNASAANPPSVTYSAGATAAEIIIFNSDCNAFSAPVVITCDASSTSYFALGASHGSENGGPPAGAVLGYGAKTNSVVGHTRAWPHATDFPWHATYLPAQQALLVTESNTGKIHWWNVANPLMPVYVRSVQLSVAIFNNFSGIPNCLGINGTSVRSYYSLYFPTDYYQLMSLTSVFVFESLTGSAWQVDMLTGTITNAFQDDLLIGKCPRVLTPLNGATAAQILFTQDGSLEVDTGQTSGVALGDIVVLDTTNFTSGGLITQTIIPGGVVPVWSASFDGVDTVWFVGQTGILAKYSITTASVIASYAGGLGAGQVLKLRSNAKFFNDKLYVTSLNGYSAPYANTGVLVVDTAALPTISVVAFQPNTDNASAGLHVHNALPLGNCLVLVTGEGSTSPVNTGSVQIYKTDGTYLNNANLGNLQNIFNLISFAGIGTYSPTNLLP